MHDDTTDAAMSMGPAGRSERAELIYHWERSTDDEREVLLRLSRQMHGKGRAEYGPLVLSGDKRNWPMEALAEVIDALFYVSVSLIVLARWWVANVARRD